MKKYIQILPLLFMPFFAVGQQTAPDSLVNSFVKATNDLHRYKASLMLYNFYNQTNTDSALYYATDMVALCRKNSQKLAESTSLNYLANQLTGKGRFAKAHQALLASFDIAKNPKNEIQQSWPVSAQPVSGSIRLFALSHAHHIFGNLMNQTENIEQEIVHYKEAVKIAKQSGDPIRLMQSNMNLGRSFLAINKLDSALYVEQEAIQLSLQTGDKRFLGNMEKVMADIYLKKRENNLALQYYYRAIETSAKQNNLNTLNTGYSGLTRFYLLQQQKDSASKYALLNLALVKQAGFTLRQSVNVSSIYENVYLSFKLSNQRDSLLKYQELTMIAKDSQYKIRSKNLSDFQIANFQEASRLQQVDKKRVIYQNKQRTYALLAGLAIFLLIALLLYRNARHQRKANALLEMQKQKVESTLQDLKSTQAQLIQSEKMASLGELTAGIAHEIQNPLNFVNNFSEVNNELIEELKSQKSKLKTEEQDEILNDIFQNNEKINHHGKRADAIVKGMLQHSRSSSGVKEPTDINALCDEYLRLSYHGLRAKDKSFSATMKTDFDTSIGKINIIPQDIGRVILNLLTNAFYAVDEKKKSGVDARLNDEVGQGYEPAVTIATRYIQPPSGGRTVEIKVSDNGGGIPQKVLDKIFQPFFTTKPTGQGTGLGLSLSYDIITKGHGGNLTVETLSAEAAAQAGKEGEGLSAEALAQAGSTFTIQIPISQV